MSKITQIIPAAPGVIAVFLNSKGFKSERPVVVWALKELETEDEDGKKTYQDVVPMVVDPGEGNLVDPNDLNTFRGLEIDG